MKSRFLEGPMTKKLELKPKSPSAKTNTESRKNASEELQVRFSQTLQGYEQALRFLQTQKFEKAKCSAREGDRVRNQRTGRSRQGSYQHL